MTDYFLVLAVTALFLILLWTLFIIVRHPRRDLLAAEKVLEFFQYWISSHKRTSSLFVAALLISSAASYYGLSRQIDQAISMHEEMMKNVYELTIVYSPDGGYAHASKENIDTGLVKTDSANNVELFETIYSKKGSSDEKAMNSYGYFAGESVEVARANMNEARRRIQIAKADGFNCNNEECNEIEDTLLGLRSPYAGTSRPTIIQYLLWRVGLKLDLFE